MNKFLKIAQSIVAAHRAQYQGIYYMKGGIGEDIVEVGSDILATVVGQPELIPLVNGAETAGFDLASGDSIGKSLGQGAISGGEALAGQEVAGAFGVGDGNTAFNNAFGITEDNPAALGLPDIGQAASQALGGAEDFLGVGGSSTGSDVAIQSEGGNTFAPVDNPTGVASSAAPGLGGGTSSVASAGAPVSPSNVSDLTNNAINQAASGADAPSTGNSPGLSPASTSSGISPQTQNLVNSFASSQAPADTITNPSVLAASNAASPGGVDGSLQQPGTFQSATNALGLTDSVSSGSSLSGASGGATSSGLSSLIPSGKTALAAAIPLGELAYQAIKGPAALPSGSQALEQGGAATAPLLSLEASQAAEGSSGQLTAPQQATINNYIQSAQNQLISQLASEGVSNPTQDSRYIQGMQEIQQNAIAQAQQYVSAAISAAVSAGGAASSNIATVANQQIAQDQEFQNSLTQAFGSLGSILGGVPNQGVTRINGTQTVQQ